MTRPTPSHPDIDFLSAREGYDRWAAMRAQLSIDHMSEHAVHAALAARMERARKYLDWPMLVVLRLRPVGPRA